MTIKDYARDIVAAMKRCLYSHFTTVPTFTEKFYIYVLQQ